jgi:hypothetical protein
MPSTNGAMSMSGLEVRDRGPGLAGLFMGNY